MPLDEKPYQMEPRGQIEKWLEQTREALDSEGACMLVARRLVSHGLGALDEIERLRAENERLKIAHDILAWEAVDSAPKDGTPILGRSGNEYAVVQWLEYNKNEGYWCLVVSGMHAESGEWWPEEWCKIPDLPPNA